MSRGGLLQRQSGGYRAPGIDILARSRLRDERFGYRDDPVDQVRGSMQPPPVEGPALRTPHFAASPRLGPVDHDPVLVERMRRQAVAPDPAKCLGIGSGLN